MDYARVFVNAPKLYDKACEAVQDMYNMMGDKNKLPQSVLELDKIVNEIEEEVSDKCKLS